jgi:hypothetical protein
MRTKANPSLLNTLRAASSSSSDILRAGTYACKTMQATSSNIKAIHSALYQDTYHPDPSLRMQTNAPPLPVNLAANPIPLASSAT